VMGDLNNWHFITVEPATKKNSRGEKVADEDPEQLQSLHQEALTSIAMKTSMEINVDGFGAINADEEDAPDGFYLVQWKGKPYILQAPAKVECCGVGDGENGSHEMPAGTLVCKAIYYDKIGQAPGWYEPPLSSPSKPPKTYLFWLNHVLCGDIQLESGSLTKKPGRGALISNHNKLTPYKLKLVNKHWMNELKFEKTVREKLEHVPVVIVD
jgi:hypothetical protein